MRARYLTLFFLLTFKPSEAADILHIGGTDFTSWHIEKWFVSCTTDKIENRSSCGAEINAFDLPEPKQQPDASFFMIANRIDLHTTAINGACASYMVIDRPHLKMNPATEIRWRNEKMSAPYVTKSFQDVGGARMFPDDKNLSLQKAIQAEGFLYVKTIGANGEVSFSMSTKGYRQVCETILAKERELNGRQQ